MAESSPTGKFIMAISDVKTKRRNDGSYSVMLELITTWGEHRGEGYVKYLSFLPDDVENARLTMHKLGVKVNTLDDLCHVGKFLVGNLLKVTVEDDLDNGQRIYLGSYIGRDPQIIGKLG